MTTAESAPSVMHEVGCSSVGVHTSKGPYARPHFEQLQVR